MSSLTIVYPHGAGGQWLSRLLTCIVDGSPWTTNGLNFHTNHLANCVKRSHHLGNDSSIKLVLDSPHARYNFWNNYVRKRVCLTLAHTRHGQRRLYRNPYDDTSSPQDDLFWLIDQCRFIQEFDITGQYTLDWIDIIDHPDYVIEVLSAALDCVGDYKIQPDLFHRARNDYINTLTVLPKINPNHYFFKIWAIACLQKQGITPNFPLFDYLDSDMLQSFLLDHLDGVLDYTHRVRYDVSARLL